MPVASQNSRSCLLVRLRTVPLPARISGLRADFKQFEGAIDYFVVGDGTPKAMWLQWFGRTVGLGDVLRKLDMGGPRLLGAR